jgi:hypothetical protein
MAKEFSQCKFNPLNEMLRPLEAAQRQLFLKLST